jgi:hypothetical protein
VARGPPGTGRPKDQSLVGDPARSSGDHYSGEGRAVTRSLDEEAERGMPALGAPRQRLGPIISPVRAAGSGWTRGGPAQQIPLGPESGRRSELTRGPRGLLPPTRIGRDPGRLVISRVSRRRPTIPDPRRLSLPTARKVGRWVGTGRKPKPGAAQKTPGGNPDPKQPSGVHHPRLARAAVRRCGNPQEGLCARTGRLTGGPDSWTRLARSRPDAPEKTLNYIREQYTQERNVGIRDYRRGATSYTHCKPLLTKGN